MGPQSLLWQAVTGGAERCVVSESDAGYTIEGIVVLPLEGTPSEVRYALTIDESWRTRKVVVDQTDGGRRSLTLWSDGNGHWTRDGTPLPEIDGCLDVDLEVSPSTNTLPIRRLGLAVGEVRPVRAAWVRFPSLKIQRLEQTYERLAEHRYRYRAATFMADLAVDQDGLVIQYDALWHAVASSRVLSPSVPTSRPGDPGT